MNMEATGFISGEIIYLRQFGNYSLIIAINIRGRGYGKDTDY